MKALLKNYHQSPRKVRLVADLIRGKMVSDARAVLSFLPKKSAPMIGKLLDSAVANARQGGFGIDALYIKTITVDKGTVLRRFRPFGRGRSGALHKEMSHIKLELGAAIHGDSSTDIKSKAITSKVTANTRKSMRHISPKTRVTNDS
jgi:large subunit ribosomal protein L22